jgi:hypothetical protein
MVFGGKGIFLATLTGPGIVILQSLPFDKFVTAISSRMPIALSHSIHSIFGGDGFGGFGRESEMEVSKLLHWHHLYLIPCVFLLHKWHSGISTILFHRLHFRKPLFHLLSLPFKVFEIVV